MNESCAFSLFHVFLELKEKLGVHERAKPVDSPLSQMSRRSGPLLPRCPCAGPSPWAGRAAPGLSLQVHSWLGSSEGLRPLTVTAGVQMHLLLRKQGYILLVALDLPR